jgi:hypothetical protein
MRKGVWVLTRLKMSGGAPLFLSRRKNRKGLVGLLGCGEDGSVLRLKWEKKQEMMS